jgi:N-methylhydantoinase B
MPIYLHGELVAFTASTAHLPDIGGRIRGPDSRSIFEEGLQIPPMKLYETGRPVEPIFEMLRRNVRVPDQVIGDLMAQVTANELAARRLQALLEETGEQLDRLASAIHQQSESAMRRAIAAIPDGEYTSNVHPDGVDEPLTIQLRLTVSGDGIHADYAGSSPQIDYALNSVMNYTFAYTAFPLKCITSPLIPNNEGSFAPITVSAPLGTIVNPTYPAPVGGRALIGHFLSALVFQALAPVLPEAIQAPSGSPLWCLNLAGQRDGRTFAVVNFINGGQGASARQAGIACLSFPSNVSNTPIEIMEAQSPMRIERKQLRRGSGGGGAYRGGDGQELEVAITGEHPLTAAFLADRLHSPAAGVLGGQPGATGELTINGEAVNPKFQRVLQPGDRLVMRTPGGGGYGTSR